MCDVLMSINPEYVELIFNGEKKYEFRKNVCKRRVDKIIIYNIYLFLQYLNLHYF